jgi:hypothetical protein
MIQAPEPLSFEKLLSASWSLFKRNWIVAAPMFIAVMIILVALAVFAGIAIAMAVSAGLFAQRTNVPNAGFISVVIVGYLVLVVGSITLGLWAVCASFGMADAAWERGTTTFADGNAAFRSRAGAMIVAMIGVIGLAILAFILALPTLGIALLALPLFTMYVMPAVVSGRRAGFDAIAESFRLVRYNFATSAITAVVLYAISYGISFVGLLPILPLEFAVMSTATGSEAVPQLPAIPYFVFGGIGYLICIALSLAYHGFYAIAVTGLYRSLPAHALGSPPAVTTIVPIAPP